MIRRRRPARGVAFSFDSFLDVVTNVVGIILRLILVAWVGARSYKAVVPAPPPVPAAQLPAPTDPLAAVVQRRRAGLAAERTRLADALRRGEEILQKRQQIAEERRALEGRLRALGAEKSALAGKAPAADFRYGLSGWEAEPVRAQRGETAGAALAEGSDFRRVVDVLDPDQTAVTLWVYPDSFGLYRALRDYLHDREVVVAGRPLPE